jgi:hypothetical protein
LRSGADPPKEAKASSVSTEYGIWLDDGNSPTPCGEQGGAQENLQLVAWSELWAFGASSEDVDLVSKHGVFNDQVAARADRIGSHARNLVAKGLWFHAAPDSSGDVLNPIYGLH